MRIGNRGYTLVEVLVAVAILAIMLPALTRFVVSSRQTGHGNAQSEIAAALAQRVLDSLAQVPPGSRTGDGTATSTTWHGYAFTVVWNYQSTASKGYTGATPGAVNVRVSYAFGRGARSVAVDGILP